MKIHILTHSTWFEPPRLRKQLALLLAERYQVEYHAPIPESKEGSDSGNSNVILRDLKLMSFASSTPPVTLKNSITLRKQISDYVDDGDVVFCFMPCFFLRRPVKYKLVAVMNDDFPAMAPSVMQKWQARRWERFIGLAHDSLFTSSYLIKKYSSQSKGRLFYPWAERRFSTRDVENANIILYWGYISRLHDFDAIGRMAKDLAASYPQFEVYLVGPVSPDIEADLDEFVASNDNVKLYPPTDLKDLPVDRVLFGIELFADKVKVTKQLELPNKAPGLISYGIPLVYSGCDLLPYECLIKYSGCVADTIKSVTESHDDIEHSIDLFLSRHSTKARLSTLNDILYSPADNVN